jgi:hypothetical protein
MLICSTTGKQHVRATNQKAKGPIFPAKALPCEFARQRSPGKDADGNNIIDVRIAKLAWQSPLPYVHCAAVHMYSFFYKHALMQ